MFGVRDPIPRGLPTCVVYKFLCIGCNVCYVGESSRHLSTRVCERMVSDKNSHVFRHLQSSQHCRTLCSDECFSNLYHASPTLKLKIKESILIQWGQATLNHQLYHINLKLSL